MGRKKLTDKPTAKIKNEIKVLQRNDIIPFSPLKAIDDRQDKDIKDVAFDLFMEGKTKTEIAKILNIGRSTVQKISKEERWQEKLTEYCEEARKVISRMTPKDMEKYVPKIIDWVKILNLIMTKGHDFFKSSGSKNPFESSSEALTGLKFVSSELQRLGFFAPEVLHVKSENKTSVEVNFTKEDMILLWECYELASDNETSSTTESIE